MLYAIAVVAVFGLVALWRATGKSGRDTARLALAWVLRVIGNQP